MKGENIVKVGIVGCGNIINRHIAGIKANKNLKLVAVCDRRKERADLFAKQNHCQAYYDYQKMLKNKVIDLISICTPSHLHALMTVEAAKNKKHVITEKPIALTLKDAQLMIEECKKNKARLFVVNQRRFNPTIQQLEKAFKKNRFGRIILVNTTMRWSRPQSYYDEENWRGDAGTGGGVLLNQSVHFIDLLQIFGGKPASVFAIVKTQDHRISAEDTALAIISFKNGALGTIEATTCVFQQNLEGSITIIGEKGTVKIGGRALDKIEVWDFKDLNRKDAQISSDSAAFFAKNPSYGHIKFYEEVQKALSGKRVDSINGEEALKSLKIILACYQSAKVNKKIII